jgi:hypothetical protein
MTPEQISEYLKNKNFQRNESMWVLSTVDKLPPEDIGKQFGISADAVSLIVELHQRYWDATQA